MKGITIEKGTIVYYGALTIYYKISILKKTYQPFSMFR